MKLDHVAKMVDIQFIMTCHKPVPEYGEMDQMVSQRETHVRARMVKIIN